MEAFITTNLAYFKMNNIKPNFTELSRQYNVDRHTLKKYYDAGGYKPRKKREYNSYYDTYLEIIKEKLEINGITYIGIYKFLVNSKGLSGTYSNFKAYLKSKNLSKPKHKTIPHVRYETPFGKQLQVDWKEDIKLTSKNGEIFTFNLFSACLSCSRLHLFIYSENKTEEAFIRCLIESLYHFGGLPKEILTDNMSAIVNINKGKKVKHNRILQLEKDLGIPIKLCKARTPETKGKVESQNRFVSRLLAYNNEIESKDEILELIKKLNVDVNNEINSSTLTAPNVLFAKEKEYLSPIPSKCVIDAYITDSITFQVPQTLLVNYKGSQYSVPMKYINKRVKLIQIDNTLHIYYNTELITIHDISNNKINYKANDYIEALSKAIQSKSQDEIVKIAKDNLELLEKGFENG